MGRTTLIVGAGNMGGALLSSWLNAGIVAPRNISILDPSPGTDAVYALERGARHLQTYDEVPTQIDVVLLAVKPQMFADISSRLGDKIGDGSLVISIMAGISSDTLTQAFPTATVVRAMPNTPAAVGKGIIAYYSPTELDEDTAQTVHALLSASGHIVSVNSDVQINAVTAISGSGPAYIFHVCEALSAAARSIGLPDDVADKLARETVIGASALLDVSDRTPTSLREAVTSPGGTTQAALSVLMAPDGLQDLMTKAVQAAFNRAEELSE